MPREPSNKVRNIFDETWGTVVYVYDLDMVTMVSIRVANIVVQIKREVRVEKVSSDFAMLENGLVDLKL